MKKDNKVLIEQLFDSKQVKSIKELYISDHSCHKSIQSVIAKEVLDQRQTFLNAKPIDLLFLICLNNNFGADEIECFNVAVFIYRFIKYENPIPYIIDDQGLEFSIKTLMSLSFFMKHMEKRWKFRGAPSPDYYRSVSKSKLSQHGHKDIALHHHRWEDFLFETLSLDW